MNRAAVLVSVLTVACGDSPAADSSRQPPPAVVKVEQVRPGQLTEHREFLGRVQPALSAELAAAASGHVRKVNVREGDRVKASSVLVALDANLVSATLDRAKAEQARLEAELAQARRQLERTAKLEYPTISEAERERFQLAVTTMEAQLASQTAQRRQAEVEMSRHLVRAPFAGVVSARHVDPGAYVAVGQPVMALVSLDDVEVHVDVSVELGRTLEPGQEAVLKGPNATAPATITGVVPALDNNTRTMRVRLAPTERPAWLIAGMAVDVQFTLALGGEGEGAPVKVSRDALVRGPVRVRVIKIVEGASQPVEVAVVATAGDEALVTGEGLAVGDVVVIRGNERLRPGQPVTITE